MIEKPTLGFFGYGLHVVYLSCWQNKQELCTMSKAKQLRSKRKGSFCTLLLLLLLLSGDIQLNPGPIKNIGSSLFAKLDTEDCLQYHLVDTPGFTAMKNHAITTQDEQFSVNLNLNTLDVTATAGGGETPGIEKLATIQSTSVTHHVSSIKSSRISGYASNKQKELKYFQTVNHAKVIWDSTAKPKGIFGGHLNIRSVLSKLNEVHNLLSNSNLDFLAMSETWLHSNIPTNMIDVPGYMCFRKDRPCGKGGGVLIYIRESLKCSVIDFDTFGIECLALNVELSSTMKFNIMVLYNPPSHSVSFYSDFDKLLKQINVKTEIILMGDFNINWMDKGRRDKLKIIASKYKLLQILKNPTRITRTTQTLIDLIFTNKPERVIKTYNFVTGLSDHNMTLVVRKLTKERLKGIFSVSVIKNDQKRIPKHKLPQFEHELKNINWESVIQMENVDQCSDLLTETLTNTIQKFSRVSKTNKKKMTLPWINNENNQLMKKRDLALKKSIKTKLQTDILVFKGLRNKVVSELRKAKSSYFMQLFAESHGNSSLIWKHINKLTNHKSNQSKCITKLNINGSTSNNALEIANELNSYFVDSGEQLAAHFNPISVSCDDVKDSVSSFYITEADQDQIHKIIKHLNGSKAKDIFDLDTTFFKKHCSDLLKPVSYLVNLSIKTSEFPEHFKTAVVTPIFKSGETEEASNYRPISKVLEKLVAEQLMTYLEQHSLLNPKQFGFRPKHSTEMAVCHFTESIKSSLDQGKCVGAIFLDLRKAVDTVNHQVLLTKLKQLDFSKQAVNWFKSYLASRQQCVKINGIKSKIKTCNLGIPQGSILGPLLFCLYINDLPEICKDTNCQLYADDTIIYVAADSPKEASNVLNRQLVSISQWLHDNCLTLNYTKTVAMCFSLKRNITDELQINIDKYKIEVVDEFKYLGVILDSKLKFDAHVRKMSKTIKTNLNCFRLIRPCISTQAAKVYLHAMVLSHMSYCSIVWGQATKSVIKPLVSLYKQTLKVFDQKPMKWHHCTIIQKYKMLTLDNFITFSFVKNIFKCLNDLAPSVMCQTVQKYTNEGVRTRAGVSGNCRVKRCRTALGQSAFSVKGTQLWNSLPLELKSQSDLRLFSLKLKLWLKSHQQCEH